MKLIVTDANVLIFLSRLDLIESFIVMDFEIHTTDYIMNEYYRGAKKETNLKNLDKYVRSGRLTIHEYGYEEIFTIFEQKSSLSLPDCSVYKLSMDLNAILLTGDKQLKAFSENSKVEVHGIIWLVDEMCKNGIIDQVEYREKLIDLKGLSQRLPADEIDRRLK
jgi:predicted nucleic acid-binding protein